MNSFIVCYVYLLSMNTHEKAISSRSKIVYIAGLILALNVLALSSSAQNGKLRVGVFNVDATPPIGSPVAYAPARSIADSLSARGIVILSDQKPIVLCAVDWIGIANEGLDEWKARLAEAANTTVDRVSVHALHQHDGVRCDFTLEGILDEYGMGGTRFDNPFLYGVINHVASAVAQAVKDAQQVTHLGFGEAEVEKVASSRRILGDNGKVEMVRYSSSTDPAAIAAPEGLIDPWLKCVSFWNEDKALAVLTYYATHPQSYYGQGDVTCEFVGIARNAVEKELDIPFIHFNGAGGNIAAGKYNDGSPNMRVVLTDRMEEGMKKAWRETKKTKISSSDLRWRNERIALPLAAHLNESELRAKLENDTLTAKEKYIPAVKLAWLKQSEAGRKVDVSSLRLGKIWLLNLPGELFIEYQLAAQQLRPDDFVCTAAYQEYGPRYIGTKIAYEEGGYETEEDASFVAPEVEGVLMKAIAEVLK